MKHQWLAYVIVAILSVGAGVAIAGLPDSVPQSETIIPPTTTVAPAPTVPSTTVSATTTEPDDAEPTGTEPTDANDGEGFAGDDEGPTTTARSATTTTTTIQLLAERAALDVAAANGSGRAGIAVATANLLGGLGYADVGSYNGEEIVDVTIVYYSAGNDGAAERLAADLGLPPEAVAPIETAPGVQELGLVELLVYVGADRA